jgi:hypothetical protein
MPPLTPSPPPTPPHPTPPHPTPPHRFALTISDAPEPSDVKYENIEAGAPSRAARRALTSALQYLSLAAGFVLVSMASGALGDRGAAGVGGTAGFGGEPTASA